MMLRVSSGHGTKSRCSPALSSLPEEDEGAALAAAHLIIFVVSHIWTLDQRAAAHTFTPHSGSCEHLPLRYGSLGIAQICVNVAFVFCQNL